MLKIKKFFLLAFAFCLCTLFTSSGQNAVYAFDTSKYNAKACVLIEAHSGRVLFEENKEKALPMASVTKLMTILLTLEQIESGQLKLDDKIVVSENAKSMGGSQIFLDANSSHEIGNLLKAVIIASANDASVALAEKIAGSEQDFVIKMNRKANQLGLCNTNFENCSGLPAPNHFSCAIDLAKIMQEVIKYPLYFEYSQIWMDDYNHPSGRQTTMSNTNKLLRTYKLCDAGKTGSTVEAGYCFCATAKQNNTRLISVVLGADNPKNRFNAAKEMFEWGFNNYETKQLVFSNEDLSKNIQVLKAENTVVEFKPETDFWALCKKNENNEYQVNLEIAPKVYAPIKKGDVIGKIIVTKNGICVAEINVVAQNDVESLSIFGTFKKVINEWNV